MMRNINIGNILNIPADDVIQKSGAENVFLEQKRSIHKEVEELIQSNKERGENKIKLYRSVLRNCIMLINNKNKLHSNEMFFKISYTLYGHPEYDVDECMKYLLIELVQLKFDVVQMDRNSIYISWKYIILHRQSQ
jgi:hypothetical protein